MKKFSILVLVLVLALSLCACGGRNDTPANTMPSTDISVIPDMNPTLDTNIPDPNVDTEMPLYTDNTDSTENATDNANANANTNANTAK